MLLVPPVDPETPLELPLSRSKALLDPVFNELEPAGLLADTMALPEVAFPSVDATVTDELVPVLSRSADLRLEPKLQDDHISTWSVL